MQSRSLAFCVHIWSLQSHTSVVKRTALHFKTFKNLYKLLHVAVSGDIGFNSLLFQNGLKEIRRIQQFFGYSHSDEHLFEILERCSLNHLRNNAESGRAKNLLVKEGKAFIFRKGNVIDSS